MQLNKSFLPRQLCQGFLVPDPKRILIQFSLWGISKAITLIQDDREPSIGSRMQREHEFKEVK